MSAPLRIAIDARHHRGPWSGIGRYLREILPALGRAAAPRHRIMAIADARTAETYGAIPGVELVVAGPPPDRHPATEIFENLTLLRLLRRLGADLFHAPNVRIPWRKVAMPLVVNVYDLVPFFFPRSLSRRHAAALRLMQRAAARRAAVLLAPTRQTAADLERLFPESRGRIAVVALAGPAPWRRTPAEIAAASAQPLVIAAGTLEPRKNLALALRAFARVAPDFPAVTFSIVGAPGPDARSLAALAASLSPAVRSRIRFEGHVSDVALIERYRAAAALVMPSHYEGFGFPVLEAFAHGCPVIASTASALVEVAGGAALHVDPGDEAGLAAALARVLGDPALRASLAEAGYARAAALTWEKTAAATLAAYEEAARRGAQPGR